MKRSGRVPHPLLLALAFFALLAALAPARAAAYPQYVFKGYGGCPACHHSPTGGGLVNSWGRESLNPTFTGLDPNSGNTDLAYDASTPATLKADVGLDVRLLPLFESDGDASVGTFIPMLTELGGALSWGRWLAYATATAKQWQGTGPALLVASREHWLEYRADSALELRIGRLVLPFGIRQPDHTQYVREDFGFDKYDQSYAIELDSQRGAWSISGSVFAGDLTGQPRQRQERGGSISVTGEFPSGVALGVSALGAASTARYRGALSAFGRAPLGSTGYLLAEVASQRIAAAKGDARFSTVAEYLRLGCFARPDMDVYLEAGHRTYLEGGSFAKGRVGLGLNWQLFRWFEFAPQALIEARAGLPTRVVGMGQIHLFY